MNYKRGKPKYNQEVIYVKKEENYEDMIDFPFQKNSKPEKKPRSTKKKTKGRFF